MRAFVTGGAGFIGSHLVDFLLKQDYYVDVLDDLSTGFIDNLPKSDRVHLHYGSASYPPLVAPLVKAADVVFHLAAVVGVNRVLQMPLRTIEQNIQSTACVLNFAAKRGVPTIITSSSEVYGRSLSPLLSESEDLHIGAHPRWGYAASKLVDEFLALAQFQEHKLPVAVVRLFNTIGPRQQGTYGSVVPRMLGQACAGHQITVYGDGTQRRCFTWVGDVVDAMFRLSWARHADGQVVNIGNTQSTTILSLAQTIQRLSETLSCIVHVSQEEAYGCEFTDIENRTPDLTKIRKLIGFNPTMDIDDMITRILPTRKVLNEHGDR